MAKAEDMGGYFRVPADVRDLNYNCYFVEGQEEVSLKEDYNSHNTTRLDVDGMMKLLMKLEIVQRAIKGEGWKDSSKIRVQSSKLERRRAREV